MRGYSLNFRDSALYETYKQILEEGYSGSIYQKLINSSAPSFFASERLAKTYVYARQKGTPLPRMSKLTHEKYEEIYRRYKIKQEQKPYLSLHDIVVAIILSPAPRYYISERQARQIIYKIRYENRRRKQAKARKI